MKKNHLTLIIQPSSAASRAVRNIASFSLHYRVIPCFILCMVLLVAFGIRGSRAIFENLFLEQDIAVLEESLAHMEQLQQRVDLARSDERKIRGFLGIESWDDDFNPVDRLGMGGTAAESTSDIESFDPLSDLEALEDERPLHVQVHCLYGDMRDLKTLLSRMAETLRIRPTIMPVQDEEIWMTSGFGWRNSPFTGLRQFHSGIDISGRRGAPIVATADGVVSRVGFDRLLGNYVRISHGDRFETTYGHLLKAKVDKGDQVHRGQVVGLMGTTGMSTGYHLHYEVVDNGKKINPYHFILNRSDVKLSASRR